ncbi:hypothetical protein M0R45_006042 [Rubus argutus]|uniref:Uncharacterized protein n=1 Tax=Rubus argutus TaxID=59490 RepID=A0AAW1YPT7_RUBAR
MHLIRATLESTTRFRPHLLHSSVILTQDPFEWPLGHVLTRVPHSVTLTQVPSTSRSLFHPGPRQPRRKPAVVQPTLSSGSSTPSSGSSTTCQHLSVELLGTKQNLQNTLGRTSQASVDLIKLRAPRPSSLAPETLRSTLGPACKSRSR